jgi:hypothetical protein
VPLLKPVSLLIRAGGGGGLYRLRISAPGLEESMSSLVPYLFLQPGLIVRFDKWSVETGLRIQRMYFDRTMGIITPYLAAGFSF